MHKAFPLPVIEFPLPEAVPTANSYEVPVSAASTATTDTTSDGTSKKKGRTIIVTIEDMKKRKNVVKARTTLLLSLPDEHQLRFEIEHDDLNQKFLTSLAPEWLMHTIVWRNRSDLDTMSLDDLYNHLKCFTASTNVPTASANIGVASISQDTACAYIASQSSGSQIKFEDINKIDEDDMEEMDIKWNMALLSMRANKLWKKTWKKISIQGTDVAGAPRSQDKGRRDNYRQGSKVKEQAPKSLMAIDGVGWDWTSKDPDSLLESQRLDKNKEGLGYIVVPPPPAQIYSSSKKDMSWTGLPEFKDDTVTDYSRPAPTIESSPYDTQNRNPSVTEEALPSTISPKSFIKFVKANDRPTNSKTDKDETAKKPHVK
nr:hypothetical protein [Tanacetum cinerariifolium]